MTHDQFYHAIHARVSKLLNEGYSNEEAYKVVLQQVYDLAPKNLKKGRG